MPCEPLPYKKRKAQQKTSPKPWKLPLRSRQQSGNLFQWLQRRLLRDLPPRHFHSETAQQQDCRVKQKQSDRKLYFNPIANVLLAPRVNHRRSMPENIGNGNSNKKCKDWREGGDQSKTCAPHAMAKVRRAVAAKIVPSSTRRGACPVAPSSRGRPFVVDGRGQGTHHSNSTRMQIFLGLSENFPGKLFLLAELSHVFKNRVDLFGI